MDGVLTKTGSNKPNFCMNYNFLAKLQNMYNICDAFPPKLWVKISARHQIMCLRFFQVSFYLIIH